MRLKLSPSSCPGLTRASTSFFFVAKTWMAGTSPAMTTERTYGVIEIGEKSTNQLFGCTNPLIFGLIARGATSWAT
jgi:hypothetical protein